VTASLEKPLDKALELSLEKLGSPTATKQAGTVHWNKRSLQQQVQAMHLPLRHAPRTGTQLS